MVKEGKVGQVDKEMNDRSSRPRSGQHSNELSELSCVFGAKHKEYGAFMDKMTLLVRNAMKETNRI